jgi:signal transduction histidine kinase
LAGDFLQFSRADRVQRGLADLDGVIEHVLRLLEPQSAAAAVRLVYERHPGLPALPIDAEKMKQVMINLVRNGIEAMPGGGQVTVRVVLRPEAAVLSVEDTGPGLPDDVDVFEIFTTTKAGGTGLGLSIARQIIASHGGAISARNVPGAGALFEITLPLGARDAP